MHHYDVAPPPCCRCAMTICRAIVLHMSVFGVCLYVLVFFHDEWEMSFQN